MNEILDALHSLHQRLFNKGMHVECAEIRAIITQFHTAQEDKTMTNDQKLERAKQDLMEVATDLRERGLYGIADKVDTGFFATSEAQRWLLHEAGDVAGLHGIANDVEKAYTFVSQAERWLAGIIEDSKEEEV